jgi:hypothetical protein
MGARIFLNGWNLNFATANREYTVLDWSVDNFAYNKADALVVFPADNHGEAPETEEYSWPLEPVGLWCAYLVHVMTRHGHRKGPIKPLPLRDPPPQVRAASAAS